jgi:hypothetical protein
MRLKQLAAATLVFSLVVAAPARARESSGVVGRTEIDQALSERTHADEASRAEIRALLGRDEVKAMAEGAGLDLRRADAAVAVLEGRELARVADRAAAASDLLAGGGQTIQISLVSLLLIIIIVILLAR